MTYATFADFEDHLATVLDGYEKRTEQQALAAAIERSIASRTHLLGQAGCGTGKSLGYSIPAVLSGQRVVISTATKALQDQIAGKDLPFLAQHLNFSFALLKGRSNYACPSKARDAEGFPYLSQFMAEIEAEGFHGERDEFSFEMTDAEWRKVAADTEDCQVYRCSKGDECFATRARNRAKAADVVVVNHSLYITDLVIRDMTGGTVSMLGEHDVVIFDEAHELEEFAASALGMQFSEGTVRSMTAETRNFVRRHWPDKDAEFESLSAQIEGAMIALWRVLPRPEGGGSQARIRHSHILESKDEWFSLYTLLKDYSTAINALDLDLVKPADLDVAKRQYQRLQGRGITTATRFADLITKDFTDLVRWVEVSKKVGRNNVTEERLFIKSTPINISDYLRPMLFANEEMPVTAILVSATMGGDEGKFIATRDGIDTYDWVDVGTPFDFGTQAKLYIPKHLPEPTPAKRTQWESMALSEMRDLVRASDGRALLLFTSTKDMRAAYQMLSEQLPYTCLMQGQKPNRVLAEEFSAETNSVLFATRSFFTGVDFQGDTCSLVVISKLPFPVPSEPRTEAICESIRAAGGNDFADYSVPVMTLILQQGFGRLIRHREDRGIVAILDPRMLTKNYGTKIMRALPESPVVTDPAAVREFFASEAVA